MVGQDRGSKIGKPGRGCAVAVITKLVKGFDPDYPFNQQGRWAGDYFDVKGEPRARWWATANGVYAHPPQAPLLQLARWQLAKPSTPWRFTQHKEDGKGTQPSWPMIVALRARAPLPVLGDSGVLL